MRFRAQRSISSRSLVSFYEAPIVQPAPSPLSSSFLSVFKPRGRSSEGSWAPLHFRSTCPDTSALGPILLGALFGKLAFPQILNALHSNFIKTTCLRKKGPTLRTRAFKGLQGSRGGVLGCGTPGLTSRSLEAGEPILGGSWVAISRGYK